MSPLLLQVMDWVRSQIVDPPASVSDERRAEAALVHRVLTGPDGPALLELLAKTTVLRPSLDPGLIGAASHDFAQRRAGENGVFAALIHLFDTHENLQRTDHDRRPDRSDRPAPVFGWWDAPGLATASDAARRPDDGGADTGNSELFDARGAVAFRG